MKNKKLTPYSKAIAMVLNSASPVSIVKMPLKKAAGLVLRKPVRGDRPLPPFNRSAMDGYAVKCADFKNGIAKLTQAGVLEAGSIWKGRLGKGQCIKIMTGAPLPDGAEAVVKVEQSRPSGNEIELREPAVGKWLNVHRKGADSKKGELLLKKGSLLTPGAMAVAASVGATTLAVTRRITVTVVTTGSELIPPEKKPTPSQIRDSNLYFLISRLSEIGWVKAASGGIVKDDPDKFKKAITGAIAKSDLVIITGGVSMGDTDYTHRVLKEIGVIKKFHKAAIRPGKPVWFGTEGKTLVFGLPGNPVSVAVTFHEFVLPALRKMAGLSGGDARSASIRLPLAKPIRKKHGLREFRVGIFTDEGGAVAAVSSYQGSGDFVSASKSDGVIVLPEKERELKAGEPVEFHPWKNC
jgi:molybdopterin molybdotransferase